MPVNDKWWNKFKFFEWNADKWLYELEKYKLKEILSGKTLEQKIDEMMSEDKLLIEGRNECGKWEKFYSQNLDKSNMGD